MRQLKRTCRRNRRLVEATAKKRSVKQSHAEIRPRKGRFTQSIVSAIGAAALIGMGTVAWAQQTNEESAVLPEVVVPGQQERDEDSYKPEAPASPKFTEPLVDIPQTVTVIPEAVIEERGATTLRDVLRNVPGISLQAGEGGVPAGDNLSIRGFNARTDLFIDGVRDFGGYSRDPFNVSQVEVFKGPASSYAGRGSTGGAINLVSKRPLLDPLYGGTIGIGTDDFKRATLDLNQPIEGLKGTALRLNALWHDADIPGRDVVTDQRWGMAPSIAFGLDTPTRLTLSYFRLDQDNIAGYGIPWVPAGNSDPVLATYADEAPPVDFSNFYGLKDRDFEKVVTDIATAEIAHDFNPSATLRNLTRYGQTRRDSVITAPRFADLDPGPLTVQGTVINRNLQSRDQTDTILANLTDLTLRFRTGGIDHAVATGIEYTHETSINYLRTGPTAPQTDLYNPNPDDPYPASLRRTGAKNDATGKSLALFLFDTLHIGERWEVTGGLRWDYFDLDYQSRAADGAVTPFERTDRMLSWRTGIVFKPAPNGSLYAAYGTSFNPSAEGLTLASTATAANNADLEPEESRTYEVGTKWNLFEERLALAVAFFRTEKTNTRTEDPTDPADVIALEGKERVDGVELSVAGNVTDQWQLFGGYALMNSEVVETLDAAEVGNELANTPKHSFSLWTTYQLPLNLEVGGGAQFVGDRFSNVNNDRTAPSYWLFDAMVAYRATESLTLRVNGYNLADEGYIESLGGGHFIPGAGRSAIAAADFQF
ncbi:MAG: TonB-dependent siderophore receptor [Candidatus Manganitrophus sp. SB1]|nr:TonB-dependent siderophore receptor [Candidatus Manganitrophus morganii]